MSRKIIVHWSFEDTEFEIFQYEEARKAASLPKTIKIDIDEEETEVEDYIMKLMALQ